MNAGKAGLFHSFNIYHCLIFSITLHTFPPVKRRAIANGKAFTAPGMPFDRSVSGKDIIPNGRETHVADIIPNSGNPHVADMTPERQRTPHSG